MRLIDAAEIVRSKNAGPFLMCLDIIFSDEGRYQKIKQNGVINEELIARLYQVSQRDVLLTYYDVGWAIKATIPRLPQGDLGDSDLYGCQQGSLLYDIQVLLD
jgi:hypothetical protein